MPPIWQVLSLLALAVGPTAGLVTLPKRVAPTLPSADPFYAVPDGLNTIAPGTILRHRTPPGTIGTFNSAAKLQSSHQILYRTTDSLGNATATVLTVLIPPKANLNKVLSYQVAEDAASINCAPSYAFQLQHASNGTFVNEAEMILVGFALNKGWVVIVPDFLGPKGAFLANALAGNSVLDGIRAAINSNSFTGIANDPTVSLWGYSGGSLASLWAAELQPSYAPEIKVAGVAAGGTVPNITTVITKVNGTSFAGLIPAGILGLANQYPDADPLLEQHILPQYKEEFYKARSLCFGDVAKEYSGKNIGAFFDDPNIVFTNPLSVKLQADNALGHYIPKVPLYIYKAIGDEVSPIGETDSLVSKYCAGGTSVQYDRVPLTTHISLAIFGSLSAFGWLEGVMSGKTPKNTCKKT